MVEFQSSDYSFIIIEKISLHICKKYSAEGSCMTFFVLAVYHKVKTCRKYECWEALICKAQDLYKEKSGYCDVCRLNTKYPFPLKAQISKMNQVLVGRWKDLSGSYLSFPFKLIL